MKSNLIRIALVVSLLCPSVIAYASDSDAAAALALAAARRNSHKPTPPKPKEPEPVDQWDYTLDLPPYPAPNGQEWKRYQGQPWKLFPLFQTAPEVAPRNQSGSTFRSGGYNSSHNCPTCGRFENRVVGFNRDGTHNHHCSVDGTIWSH